MLNKILTQRYVVAVGLGTILILTGFFIDRKSIASDLQKDPASIQTVAIKPVESQILADGMVRSKSEATLHFQTGGKLVYLPFKEGDSVYQGQTIGSLDSFALQKQLAAALNTYRSTRDVFDQTTTNSQNNYLQAQQTYPYNVFNVAGIGGTTETNAINDIVRRIIDENQANLDNSVIQVQLANYAISLASITAPFDGVIVHEDVSSTNVNITPVTSFVIADPNALVFRANVPEDEINFIQEGATATIQLTSLKDKSVTGTVMRIYPDKFTLPTGEKVYQVDIESNDLLTLAKYQQDGVVSIKNKFSTPIILVPAWLILANHNVWVMENNKPVLKSVNVGDTVGENVEILKGLSPNDRLIIDPTAVVKNKYTIL